MTLLQPMMVAALLVGGMGVALLGSIKVPLARRLEIDEARVGGLVSLFGLALIPVILAAGFLTDLLGRQLVFFSGGLLFAGSVILLARARTYGLALAAVMLLSAGWSMLMNVGNVLTPKAFPGSEVHATNLANVFFGLGAFLTPLTLALLLRRTSLSPALTLLGCLALTPPLLALGVDFVALTPVLEESAPERGVSALLANPVMWLCGAAMFFYGPMEAALGAWATTYLGGRGIPEGRASSLLAGFWLAFMASRLTTALTLPAGHEATLILVLALGSVAVLLAIVSSRTAGMAAALVVAAGLMFGPIFPTIMAILLGNTEPNLHGRAVGLFFAIGGIGWTTIPMLMGAYARRTSVQRSFLLAVAAALGLATTAAMLKMR